ncbi:MAG: hypothetical protein KJ621_16825 [Proteobacteria bacterium]|nr:hypothetical protein [Pseudomonadota bacterium]MBU1742007.1 hypothetical protein [Pseudomonadota bacterium]
MHLIAALVLILLGILAIPNLIVAKKPNAQELLDKIVPFQGWIGLAACIWGIIQLIRSLTYVKLIGLVPLLWLSWFAVAVITTLLGFLLGFSLISKFALSKNEAALEKGQAMRAKLAGIQVPLGLISIALAIWWLIVVYLIY